MDDISTPPKRKILHDVLSRFDHEPEVDLSDNSKVFRADHKEIKVTSHIGRMANKLRSEYGWRFVDLAKAISDHLGRKVSIGTFYAWVRGVTPRHDDDVVVAILEALIRDNDPIEGGYWCQPPEAQERMTAMNEQMPISGISALTGIPRTTLFSWISGLHRVPRSRIDKVERAVNDSIRK